MSEAVQTAYFEIHLRALPDGRLALQAQGNLNPALIYAQLGMLMRKLEAQMQNPSAPMVGSKTPEFKIRRLP